MSEQWFSASEEVDSGSDSDQEERGDWVQERARLAMTEASVTGDFLTAISRTRWE
jgi:hypothetical protein